MSVAGGVLDTWAVLAWLRNEGQAGAAVRRYLHRAQSGNLQLFISLMSVGEVYYRVAGLEDEEHADSALELVRKLPLEIVPVREALVLAAARLKARHKLSYADAFVVATAQAQDAFVLTGDPEILGLPRSVVAVRRLAR